MSDPKKPESVGLFRSHCIGGGRELILEIRMTGSPLPDRNNKALRDAVYKASRGLEEAINIAIASEDPKTAKEAAIERQGLLYAFYSKGITPIFVEEIPNGYSDQWYYRFRPWFVVTTPVGRFKIGWRKRVINIDWSDTVGTLTAEALFPDEDTTKGDKYIHAWTEQKAADYVAKIYNTAANAQGT